MKTRHNHCASLLGRLVVALTASVAFLVLAPEAKATNVCGPITADTTWSFINSPYVITCDVVVMDGKTLTIDPGVVVQFNPNTKLKAQNGTISAIGIGTSHVSFTSISDPPGIGVELDFPNGGNGVFTYCDFSNLNTAIQNNCCNNSGPPGAINNCTFTGCVYGMSAYHGAVHGQVNNCTFISNVYGTFYMAYRDFTNCTFQNSGVVGADVGGQCNFTLCSFISNPTGVQSQTGQGTNLDRCSIENNVIGVKGCDLMRRCSIKNNVKGIQINGVPTIECCDIYNNSTYNAEMLSGTSVNAPNNWWGTTVTTTIDASIFDRYDQASLGFLLYAPNLAGLQSTTATCACTAPSFSLHPPATLSKYPGQTAMMTATATATGTPTYQWRRNGLNLANGPRFSGVTTQTLTINPVADPGTDPNWTDAGSYTLVATNICGITTSNPCIFSTPVCLADANGNGTVTVADIFFYLSAWFAGCP